MSCEVLLDNLQRAAQHKVEQEFRRAGMSALLPELLAGTAAGAAGVPDMGLHRASGSGAGGSTVTRAVQAALNPKQKEVGHEAPSSVSLGSMHQLTLFQVPEVC